MTALARAIAANCDALPVLVILSPFEQQRVGNYLLDAGFLPLLLDDPSLGLEFVTAFGGRIAAVLVGGPTAAMSVEAFDSVMADAYPQIPIIALCLEENKRSGRCSLLRPLTRETVVRAVHDAINSRPSTS